MGAWLGLIGALSGVLLGGLLQHWREGKAWKRTTGARWLDEERRVYGELLTAADKYAHLNWVLSQTNERMDAWRERMGDEDHARPEDVQSLMQTMLELTETYDRVFAAVADIDLISERPVRVAAKRIGERVTELLSREAKPWDESELDDYKAAKEAFLKVARATLRPEST